MIFDVVMSGGRLVVLDQKGRDAKEYPLGEGFATIGSDAGCDIRVMLPNVSPHHATVAVHANQSIVRSTSLGRTLVNGAPVSVAALRHGDVIGVGGRALRWDYDAPHAPRPLPPYPALVRSATRKRRGRRASAPAARPLPAPPPRASLPAAPPRLAKPAGAGAGAGAGAASGKQVAIVQPQRRGTSDQTEAEASTSTTPHERARASSRHSEQDSIDNANSSKRTYTVRCNKTRLPKPKTIFWIEKHSRRQTSSPHRAARDPDLRLAVLRKSQPERRSAVTKIQAPEHIDHTKQAAIMLMTGHAAKVKQATPKGKTPKLVIPKPTPVRNTPKRNSRRSALASASRNSTMTTTDTNDSDARRSSRKSLQSPELLSPKKSAMKDPTAKSTKRKTDSIKFDLSNLEGNHDRSSDVMFVSNSSSRDATDSETMSLRYDEPEPSPSPSPSPSPRRAIHSRASRMLYSALHEPTQSSAGNSPLRDTMTSESYSVVDLVSIESNSSSTFYDSADSNATSITYKTPRNLSSRKARQINISSSTPYHNKSAEPNTSANSSRISRTSSRRTQSLILNSIKISEIESRSSINDSDMKSADETSSARVSRRNQSSASVTLEAASGTVTPDTRRSPEEATTPVISIQSILEQSASSVGRARRNASKRHTIAGPAGGRLGRASGRAALRRGKSCTSSREAKVVTPTSAVKLVIEGVKNKHSTSKKTTSKRNIIDNLNDSVLVKQLFNSPVKRKLSRSMTEFSRKNVFQDEDNSLFSDTNDDTFIDNTEVYPTEAFVSPLTTPGDSPNLSGVKRLFRNTSPDNDLRDVRGVKALLGSPRTRKSIKNDLSDVRGVKKLFARSPRNRLSNVRVKELFAASPTDDLRRVTRVGALFRSAKKPTTPKNTLEDVRGVKNLFQQTSPWNDLRNVSGAKRLLRVNSPRNDLSDVRGVRQLYREAVEGNELSDVSGVAALFDTSLERSDLDTTFDLLMSKPRLRTYGKHKSMTETRNKPKRTRATKSLLDAIGSSNIEEWLENEIKLRTKSKESSDTTQGLAKSNLTRELQKLTTDTIEGNSPLRTSRIRSSKKSASELYSARKLPIKKRSLAGRGSGAHGDSRLPIKKRTLLHSTPLKGTNNSTINASALGRVSPIAKLDDTAGMSQPVESSKLTIQERSRRKRVLLDILPLPASKRSRSDTASTRRHETQPGKNAKKQRSSFVISKQIPSMNPKSYKQVETGESPVEATSSRRKLQNEKKSQPKEAKGTRSTRQTVVNKRERLHDENTSESQESQARSTRGKLKVDIEKSKPQKATTQSTREKLEIENGQSKPIGKATQRKPKIEKEKPKTKRATTEATRAKLEVSKESKPQKATARSTRVVPQITEKKTTSGESTARSTRAKNKIDGESEPEKSNSKPTRANSKIAGKTSKPEKPTTSTRGKAKIEENSKSQKATRSARGKNENPKSQPSSQKNRVSLDIQKTSPKYKPRTVKQNSENITVKEIKRGNAGQARDQTEKGNKSKAKAVTMANAEVNGSRGRSTRKQVEVKPETPKRKTRAKVERTNVEDEVPNKRSRNEQNKSDSKVKTRGRKPKATIHVEESKTEELPARGKRAARGVPAAGGATQKGKLEVEPTRGRKAALATAAAAQALEAPRAGRKRKLATEQASQAGTEASGGKRARGRAAAPHPDAVAAAAAGRGRGTGRGRGGRARK